MRILQPWLVCIVAAVVSLPAQAQDYPAKRVIFITPAAAEDSPEVATRIVAEHLTQAAGPRA